MNQQVAGRRKIIVVGNLIMIDRLLDALSGVKVEVSVFQLGRGQCATITDSMMDEFDVIVQGNVHAIVVDNNWGNGWNVAERIPTDKESITLIGFRSYLLGDERQYNYTSIPGLRRFTSWRRIPGMLAEMLGISQHPTTA